MTSQTQARLTGVVPTASTLRALDWLNFFLSGVQAAVGPFLAIYLASQGWSEQQVGLVLAISTVAGIVAQAPVGWLVDWTQSKRALIAGAIVTVAGGSVGIAAFPRFCVIVSVQVLMGVALTIFVPTMCAMSLGLVGRTRFDARQGRNQAFIAAGSVGAALAAGAAAYYSSNRAIFFLVLLSATPALLMLARVRGSEIDHAAAREAAAVESLPVSGRRRRSFRQRPLRIFMLSAVLMNFANAAMLPLIGEMVGRSRGKSSMLFMAACVVTAQMVMLLLSSAVGRKASAWGRRPLLLVAFGLLPVRALLYLLTKEPSLLVAIELLDGVCSSLFAVVSVLVIADLARGTGRFNLTLGVLTMAINVGASLSQVTAGYVAFHYGFDRAFLCLALIAALGFANVALFMPETVDRSL